MTKPTPDTHVKCPDCAEYIKYEASVCKHCGCKVVPSDPPKKQPPYGCLIFVGIAFILFLINVIGDNAKKQERIERLLGGVATPKASTHMEVEQSDYVSPSLCQIALALRIARDDIESCNNISLSHSVCKQKNGLIFAIKCEGDMALQMTEKY